ncbi:MAG: hypothetical protein BGO39_08580 [Chloroflexi bacterium 54-19]|mgnify:FL=1|nr:MAG: hypothetical protein BGO39_08580 [Chloroflexi bacterium 54-19]
MFYIVHIAKTLTGLTIYGGMYCIEHTTTLNRFRITALKLIEICEIVEGLKSFLSHLTYYILTQPCHRTR